MAHIEIISSSVRIDRKSHHVALFFKKFIENHQLATVNVLDLHQYNFPLFDERLKFQKNPSENVLDFASKIKSADGVIIVTPEYNGGYPASLKNAIDLLMDEWKRKPVAIAAVSAGAFGGAQVVTSLEFVLWKLGVLMVPAKFHVAKVGEAYDENGNAVNKDISEKMAAGFVNELLWCIGKNSGKL
jgi:NAD(P)H-dependent FMN reductase